MLSVLFWNNSMTWLTEGAICTNPLFSQREHTLKLIKIHIFCDQTQRKLDHCMRWQCEGVCRHIRTCVCVCMCVCACQCECVCVFMHGCVCGWEWIFVLLCNGPMAYTNKHFILFNSAMPPAVGPMSVIQRNDRTVFLILLVSVILTTAGHVCSLFP